MKERRKLIITDAMSQKEVSPAIRRSLIVYERVTGSEEIKNYLDQLEDAIEEKDGIRPERVYKIKRDGYAYGLSLTSWGNVCPTSEDTMVDAPYGSIVVNVGIANPTKMDLNDRKNWDLGHFDLEIRVLYVRKPVGSIIDFLDDEEDE